MLKLYPSSLGFKVGDLIYAQYSPSCIRYQLVAHNGAPRESIDEKHGVRGNLNEELWAVEYVKLGAKESLWEVPFKLYLDDIGVVISGRIDFIIDGRIKEHKSTESASVIKDTIKDGRIKPGTVAQTLCYILSEGVESADVVYSGYKFDKKAQVYVRGADRTFEVALDADGFIYVDQVKFGFTLYHMLDYIKSVAAAVADKTIAPRPVGSGFSSPCRYCSLSSICDKYDKGQLETSDDFINSALEELQRKGTNEQLA